MTFYSFHLLSPVVQRYWVLKHGTFLDQRWEADDEGVNSYLSLLTASQMGA